MFTTCIKVGIKDLRLQSSVSRRDKLLKKKSTHSMTSKEHDRALEARCALDRLNEAFSISCTPRAISPSLLNPNDSICSIAKRKRTVLRENHLLASFHFIVHPCSLLQRLSCFLS